MSKSHHHSIFFISSSTAKDLTLNFLPPFFSTTVMNVQRSSPFTWVVFPAWKELTHHPLSQAADEVGTTYGEESRNPKKKKRPNKVLLISAHRSLSFYSEYHPRSPWNHERNTIVQIWSSHFEIVIRDSERNERWNQDHSNTDNHIVLSSQLRALLRFSLAHGQIPKKTSNQTMMAADNYNDDYIWQMDKPQSM